jgi:hypothetical protein
MNLRRTLLAVLTLGCLLALPARAGLFDKEVAFSEAEVQAAIDKKGPQQRNYAGLLTAALREPPRITLGAPENRIGVAGRIDLSGPLLAQPLPVDMIADTGIRYDDERKAFFLENPVITSLTAPGLNKDQLALAREAVASLLSRYLQKQPVYVLREDGSLQEKAARWLLKSIRVETGRVVAVLSPF